MKKMDKSKVVKLYNILKKQQTVLRTELELKSEFDRLSGEKKKILQELLKLDPNFQTLPFHLRDTGVILNISQLPSETYLILNNYLSNIK